MKYTSYILLTLIIIIIIFIGVEINKKSEVYNLVLITIDTLRADHLGCYGYKYNTSPNLDKLANQNILFKNVFVQVPLTFPSHTSILTGTTPIFHGIKDNSFFKLRKNIPTLAEILKKYGYKTYAVISGDTLSKRKGLNKGFEKYIDLDIDNTQENQNGFYLNYPFIKERKAEKSVKLAISLLKEYKKEKNNNPFFLWLHLFDPHAEYNPPSPFRERFINCLYDGEIAYTDFWIGKFFDFLKENNIYKNTLIVITADHGEGLGEHKELSHGYYLFNSTLHVPLIIKAPQLKSPKKIIDKYIQSIDIMPTILSLLEIKDFGQSQGKDYSYLILNKKFTHNINKKSEINVIYSETYYPYYSFRWRPLRAIIYKGYKYIDSNPPLLFNIKKDPYELNNLFNKNSIKILKLVGEIKSILKKYSQEMNSTSYTSENLRALQKLEALGYYHYETSKNNINYNSLPNPIEMGDILLKFVKAQSLMRTKQSSKAIKIFKEILKKDPNNLAVISLLGKIYTNQNKLNEALIYFYKLNKLLPNSLIPKKAIIDILIQQKKYNKAEKEIKNILKIYGEKDDIILSRLSYIKLMKKEYKKALKYAQKTIIENPYLPSGWFYLGLSYKNLGNYKKAGDSFLNLIKIKPYWKEIYLYCAECYYKNKEYLKALQILNKFKKLTLIKKDNNQNLLKNFNILYKKIKKSLNKENL